MFGLNLDLLTPVARERFLQLELLQDLSRVSEFQLELGVMAESLDQAVFFLGAQLLIGHFLHVSLQTFSLLTLIVAANDVLATGHHASFANGALGAGDCWSFV